MHRSVLTFFLIVFLTACGGPDMNNKNYPNQYLDAISSTEGAVYNPDAIAENFQSVFANLTGPDLQKRVEATYAADLYFNDTLKTMRTRSDLVAYFQETGEKVEELDVEILSAFRDGSDIYLRWRMDMRFRAVGKRIATRTVGMSHLRVNADGKVILQQDFWDAAEGIYRELPLIGSLISNG